jgi:hypothetical protein
MIINQYRASFSFGFHFHLKNIRFSVDKNDLCAIFKICHLGAGLQPEPAGLRLFVQDGLPSIFVISAVISWWRGLWRLRWRALWAPFMTLNFNI